MAHYAVSLSSRQAAAKQEKETSSSTLLMPIRGAARAVNNLIPFSKKGAVVLIRGRPAIEPCHSSASSNAALTAVRFRGQIEPGDDEPGRYFLLVSHGDPWAQRTLIAHGLAELKQDVGIVCSDGFWPLAKGLPAIATQGWRFSKRKELKPTLFKSCGQELQLAVKRGSVCMHQLYAATDPEVTGRVTIPVLWDAALGRVVNNDSGEIVRILHQDLRQLGRARMDLNPAALRPQMDRVRPLVYCVNAGVYKCGYAMTREGHERALRETFSALEALEKLLAERRYLAGDDVTEVDVLAFPTLLRFDACYYTAFRCNHRRIRDYPNISRYLRQLYEKPAFKETVHMPTYAVVHFIEARWQGRVIGNLCRLVEAAVEIATGAALPGASWWRRAASRIATLPARVLSRIFK